MGNGGQLAQAAARLPLRRRPLIFLAFLLAFLALSPLDARAQPELATLMADSITIDPEGRLVAEGAVEVWHGNTRLNAARVTYDPASERIQIEGPLILSDGPNSVMLADQGDLSRDFQEAIFHGARIVLNQRFQITAVRGTRRNAERTTRLERVVASACEVCETNPTPLWELRASQVDIDQNAQRIYYRNAQFRFRGVPLLYLPRASSLMDGVTRASGALTPFFGLNGTLGFRASAPWFFTLGDQRDLTLTPTVFSSGAASLGFRYRVAHHSGGVQATGLVATDRVIPGAIRGFLRLNGLYALPRDFTLTFDGTWVSDGSLASQYVLPIADRLERHVTVERIRRDQMIRLRALWLEVPAASALFNSQEPSYIAQGGIEQRFGLGHTAIGGSAWLALDSQAFMRPSSVNQLGRDALRARLRLGWQRQETLHGGLRLRFAAQGEALAARYFDDAAYPAPITHLGGQAMVELRWPVARTTASGARQVVEPVAQVILGTLAPNLPNDDHRMPELDGANLFSLNRYSGFDGADTGSRANLGLAFSHYNPSGWTFDFLAGRVLRLQSLPGFTPTHRQPLGVINSDWFVGVSAEWPGRLRTGLAVTLDDTGRLNRGQAGLQLSGDRSSLSTTLSHMPALAEERRAQPFTNWATDVSYTLADGWYARFGWTYQMLIHQTDTRAGLTYRNECILFDAGLQQTFVGPNNSPTATSFVLRVELLGLSGAPPPGRRACRI